MPKHLQQRWWELTFLKSFQVIDIPQDSGSNIWSKSDPTLGPTSDLTWDLTSDPTSDMTSKLMLHPNEKQRLLIKSSQVSFFPMTFLWAGFVSGLVRIGPVGRFRFRLCTWEGTNTTQPSTRILVYSSFSLNLSAANFKRRMCAFM